MLSLNCTVTLFSHLSEVIFVAWCTISYFSSCTFSTFWWVWKGGYIHFLDSVNLYAIWHHLSPASKCLELTSPCSLLSLSKFQVPCLPCDFRFLMVSSGNHESEVFPVGKMLFSASHISWDQSLFFFFFFFIETLKWLLNERESIMET